MIRWSKTNDDHSGCSATFNINEDMRRKSNKTSSVCGILRSTNNNHSGRPIW